MASPQPLFLLLLLLLILVSNMDYYSSAAASVRAGPGLLRQQQDHARRPHYDSSYYSQLSFPNDSWIDRNAFPDNFKFGSLTWAIKHEGATTADGKGVSLWDAYAAQEGTVIDNTTPANSSNHYYQYAEDILLLKDLGMDSFKISIAWSRIFPNGTGELNEKAVAHYNDVINEMIAQGIEPHVTLYEQDIPQVLEDAYGGLLSPLFIDDFVNFANACFAAFGDRVKHWSTFEEGNDYVAFAYAGTWGPPGRCTIGLPPYNCTAGNSSTEPYIAAHHMLLAHAATVELYRSTYQPVYGGEIGLIIWFRWFEPLSNSTEDLAAAQRATDFTVGWFVEPLLYGDYPVVMRQMVGARLPNFTEEEKKKLQGSVDFIGLNAITAIYVTRDEEYHAITGYFQDWQVKTTAYKDGEIIGKYDGEYFVPWCMEKIVSYMRTHYDNFPTYITALGHGIPLPLSETINDVDRLEFFSSYLKSLIEGISAGADVRGLFVWSLIDGFETIMGLHTRFGLYYVDEDFVRYPRLSALWLKEILTSSSSSSNDHYSRSINLAAPSSRRRSTFLS